MDSKTKGTWKASDQVSWNGNPYSKQWNIQDGDIGPLVAALSSLSTLMVLSFACTVGPTVFAAKPTSLVYLKIGIALYLLNDIVAVHQLDKFTVNAAKKQYQIELYDIGVTTIGWLAGLLGSTCVRYYVFNVLEGFIRPGYAKTLIRTAKQGSLLYETCLVLIASCITFSIGSIISIETSERWNKGSETNFMVPISFIPRLSRELYRLRDICLGGILDIRGVSHLFFLFVVGCLPFERDYKGKHARMYLAVFSLLGLTGNLQHPLWHIRWPTLFSPANLQRSTTVGLKFDELIKHRIVEYLSVILLVQMYTGLDTSEIPSEVIAEKPQGKGPKSAPIGGGRQPSSQLDPTNLEREYTGESRGDGPVLPTVTDEASPSGRSWGRNFIRRPVRGNGIRSQSISGPDAAAPPRLNPSEEPPQLPRTNQSLPAPFGPRAQEHADGSTASLPTLLNMFQSPRWTPRAGEQETAAKFDNNNIRPSSSSSKDTDASVVYTPTAASEAGSDRQGFFGPSSSDEQWGHSENERRPDRSSSLGSRTGSFFAGYRY
ncbi:hypothetical protein ABW19_dt0203502 [Dactylella cylindrospora]|nr:hypothetical protein ABW19_dt0203502 [Dactylella cylindrospora]